MDLTPIRIRGKRGQKRFLTPDLGSPLSGSESPARRRKLARSHKARQDLKKRQLVKNPSLSALQQLPTEILQLIFEYSMNLNLPLVTPSIANQLSHERTYIRFAVDVLYRHEDGQEPDIPTISRMLACRWMSWELFNKVINQTYHRAQQDSTGRAIEDDLSDSADDVSRPELDRPWLQSPLGVLHLPPRCSIPAKLLKGPWTSDKVSFLYYLVWSGLGIDWEHSTVGEVATHGLRQAIQEHNRVASACLLHPNIGVTPTASLVKSAIIDYGCDPTIVFHLLSAALRLHILARTEPHAVSTPTDFTFRDPSIWSWAGRARARGDEKGEWLTRALRYAAETATTCATYDTAAQQDFERACGRVEDGVEQTKFPRSVRQPPGD